ncbi:MAG: PAS domain S-box protein [Arcobacteraceae bacterium]|nr:PAS domain S-box protein [Arcobacteraceae bacterium]
MSFNFKFKPSNYNILIIEDSKSVNKILTKTFTDLGYNCFSAVTLQEGKDFLKDNEIHYLMLDINLPDGSGYELITKLENTSEKIFVLTTETDKQFRDISYQKGVIDFIVKDKDFFHKIHQITTTIEQLEKNRFKTILIIDDSLVIQEQLKDIFKNRHYHVEIASDTATALDIINTKQVDLILLDVQLKDTNGIEFLQKNKIEIVNKRKIPVMIISGNIESATIRDGLKAGAVDIIKKPYIIEEIVLKVDLWIDYKRKEDEVTCSVQLLNQYKETVDESAIVSKTDPKGIITYINEEFCSISGYTKEELLGKNHNIVRHEDMPSLAFKDLWHTIKELKQTWKGTVKNRKKDGSAYWVKAIIKPILDINGDVIEYIGIRTDITEHEQVKEYFKHKLNSSISNLDSAMKLSKEYEMAINESNIVSRSNLAGKITYVNDKFTEVSGYTKEEVIGKNHNMVRHEDTPKEIFYELWETIKSGKPWSGIIKNKAKSGEPYWVDTTIVPIKDENNKIIEYMAIRHDLTELFNLHKEIEDTQKEIVYKMGEIGESRSKETGNHVKRVAEYSKILAHLYGLSEHDSDILFTASPMHDIGKVGIPDSILKKPGKLTDEEFDLMKTHTDIGYSILKGSKREVLKAASIVSNEHHEKWNGRGYPQGLKGEDIHIYGRITAVADVFDALGSDRCYKKAWDDKKIFKLFEEEKGEQFDPKLIDLFFENKDMFLEIREKYKD